MKSMRRCQTRAGQIAAVAARRDSAKKEKGIRGCRLPSKAKEPLRAGPDPPAAIEGEPGLLFSAGPAFPTYSVTAEKMEIVGDSGSGATISSLGGAGKVAGALPAMVASARARRLYLPWSNAAVALSLTIVTAATVRPILTAQVNSATFIMTDEGGAAKKIGSEFILHGSVNHSIGEYVRGDIHTNTIEGYFSILKRGINGVYHHVSQEHLKRYLAEFESAWRLM
jgi:hypothetical protein